MLKIKSALFIFAALSSFIISSANAVDYSNYWCQEVDRVLRAALDNSIYTDTYQEEKELFLNAISISIEQTPAKNNYYFLRDLEEISEGLKNYSKDKEQVEYLRRETRYALYDLAYFDRTHCRNCEGDNGAYVITVLKRGLGEGLAVKTDAQESFTLDHAAQLAMNMIDDSDYRRSYTCAYKNLENAKSIANLPMKRQLVKNALDYMENRLFCRQ